MVDILENRTNNRTEKIELIMRLCVNYAEMIAFLHNSLNGTLVNCDSNSVDQALEQVLVGNDMALVLNDLDLLHEAKGKSIVCKRNILIGNIRAPEMTWPFLYKDSVYHQMPKYDEKSDIWKVPIICEHFLSMAEGSEFVKKLLVDFHKKCMIINPDLRPTALEVVAKYKKVLQAIL